MTLTHNKYWKPRLRGKKLLAALIRQQRGDMGRTHVKPEKRMVKEKA